MTGISVSSDERRAKAAGSDMRTLESGDEDEFDYGDFGFGEGLPPQVALKVESQWQVK